MAFDDDSSDAPEHVPMFVRRSRTVSMRRLTRTELAIGSLLWPERNFWRPSSRGDCNNVCRPCPYVSCRYHLYLDVHLGTGSLQMNFPELEPWEIEQSCALDLADAGEHTLDEVGVTLNVTRERVRQIEVKAFAKLASNPQAQVMLADFLSLSASGNVVGVLRAAVCDDSVDDHDPVI